MAHFPEGLCLATGSGSTSQSPCIESALPPSPPSPHTGSGSETLTFVKGSDTKGPCQVKPRLSLTVPGRKSGSKPPPWVLRAPARSRTSLCQVYHGFNTTRAFACTSLRCLTNTPVCAGTLYGLDPVWKSHTKQIPRKHFQRLKKQVVGAAMKCFTKAALKQHILSKQKS